MKIAYVDCYSGISGDMFLGALLDAGLPLEHLTNELRKLDLPDEWILKHESVMKGPIRASLLKVEIPHESHAHRHPGDIYSMINASELSAGVKTTARRIFARLAQAEASVHGIEMEKVHFHEVGAVDSILDIVGAAVGLEALRIEKLYASALPLGSGEVITQHGPLPVPAPATLELLAGCKASLRPSPAGIELVTPTGAAILAELAEFAQPAMQLNAIGTGAGRKDLAWPNILRILVGQTTPGAEEEMAVLETNIDDMNPQFYAPLLEKLFQAGALDAWLTPMQMKKNRPGIMLSVISRRKDEPSLANLILHETTTFGIRVHAITRYESGRDFITVETPYGPVRLKRKLLDGKAVYAAPEYEDCLAAAKTHNIPIQQVYLAAQIAAGRED